MPRRDGTGPFGRGPFTGRGFGGCMNYGDPVYRRGFRRFWGPGSFYDSPESREELLKEEKSFLKARLEELEKLIKDD
ncbi:MAG: DUF5320 domain-containing protein [Anaerovoracaceae bacterium]|nr:DUF5320 domain-containing protein [Clostridiales bacterium]